ncbi:hypothetical protein [Magnetospirillum gryphiswaldense]|uniref:hypothetical protein n=1 Tax=Magnetospirillum gryphiswaldense TaxID=55518 RepID=UPI000D03C403|nr:hypothetical protein [Magnetospirillum gryphiswaldense]AVM76073.1 hypothetical protein MSR1_36120 [Magnetospirillum gryphiswaldense MSR-1]AVM79976.1 hypothetical protein MSR1L_36120 [Magnetospirillum gryphiswaldense]
MKGFDLQDFERFSDGRNECERPYNKPLYALFSEDRGHKDVEYTASKIMYVSRMYKANLELNAGRSNNPDVRNIQQLAESLCKSEIFRNIVRINYGTSLTEEAAAKGKKAVAAFEGEIRRLFDRKVGGVGYWTFCSKYLHFHSKNVVLFDTNARVSLARCFDSLAGRVGRNGKDAAITYDEYVDYFMMMLRSIHGERSGYEPREVKNLDCYLVLKYRETRP